MTTNSIVDIRKKPDTSKQKIFFGETDNVIRVDRFNNHKAKHFKEESEGNTWFTKEIDCSQDRPDQLPEVAARIFQLNVGYQTVMDSGVSNGYLTTVAPLVTDPIWKTLYNRIGIEEVIHAESYSYSLEQMFGSKAEEFLDIIYSDKVVQTRMNNEIECFDEVREMMWSKAPESDQYKKAILRMLTASYLMEGIKFTKSFYVSFAINKSYFNCIQGFTRLLKLIAHDEMNIHIPTNALALITLRTDERQGFKHLFDNGWYDQMTNQMVDKLVEEELGWSKYLLQDGAIPGYNYKIAEHFVKYWTRNRLNGIKVNDHKYQAVRSNDIVSWFNSYRDINKSNGALQEMSNNSYQKGVVQNDMDSSESWIYTPSYASLGN